jgi:hypothetical protein
MQLPECIMNARSVSALVLEAVTKPESKLWSLAPPAAEATSWLGVKRRSVNNYAPIFGCANR